jgi:hypothetical protein
MTMIQTDLQDAAIISPPQRWMNRVLVAAGIYNLVWGAGIVLLPQTTLTWFGMDPLNYPAIWQCVGMLVGVYGIAYLLAATDPLRQWPIVLVGLLGKLFGPIGFLWAAAAGELPWAFGWLLLLNDVVWWLPFSAILYVAIRGACNTSIGHAVDREDAIALFSSQRGASLGELSVRQPLMVVFLRHMGCTFCREALSDLAAQRRALESLGVQLAVVHMGAPLAATLMLQKHGLEDVHRFSDPECELYRAFALDRGSPLQLMGPKIWWRGVQSLWRGHGLGSISGDAFRMPGVFVLVEGEVIAAYRHRSAADRPDYVAIAHEALRGSTRAVVGVPA